MFPGTAGAMGEDTANGGVPYCRCRAAELHVMFITLEMYNHLDAMAWEEVEVGGEMKEEDY